MNSICLVSNSYERNHTLKTVLEKENIEIKIVIEKFDLRKKFAIPQTLKLIKKKRGALEKKYSRVIYF